MVGKNRMVVWDNEAKQYLKTSLQYIKLSSPQNADIIKAAIRLETKEITKYPERYPTDKYRLKNNGDYRVLLLYNFRISYFIGPHEIRIVRIRHAKQAPQYY